MSGRVVKYNAEKEKIYSLGLMVIVFFFFFFLIKQPISKSNSKLQNFKMNLLVLSFARKIGWTKPEVK